MPLYCSPIFIESQFQKVVKRNNNKKVLSYIIRAFADGLGTSYNRFMVSKSFHDFLLPQNDYYTSCRPLENCLLQRPINIHITFNPQTPYRLKNRMFKLSNIYDVKAVLWIT